MSRISEWKESRGSGRCGVERGKLWGGTAVGQCEEELEVLLQPVTDTGHTEVLTMFPGRWMDRQMGGEVGGLRPLEQPPCWCTQISD